MSEMMMCQETSVIRTFLVVQWLRIRLQMQETPVQQAPTRRRAAKPMHHNYRAMALASSL